MTELKACKLCIEAYNLPQETLGEDGNICKWCCVKIFDIEKVNLEINNISLKIRLLLSRNYL